MFTQAAEKLVGSSESSKSGPSETDPSLKPKCCTGGGPGYESPMQAFKNGPREQIMFVALPNSDVPKKPDMLVSVDVNPDSAEFCKIISKLAFPNVGDELHHTGWNACSSCYNDACKKRTHLILPCLNSHRVYVVDTTDPRNLKLHKTVEAQDLLEQNVSSPHTPHCLQDGQIMISTLGDARGEGQGNFVLIDAETFEVTGKWPADGEGVPFGYDFWYQPRCNVMASTEWGTPNRYRRGLSMKDIAAGHYGSSIHIWDWSNRTLKQTIQLDGPTGMCPFEIRFLHNPDKPHAFFVTVIGSAVYHLYRDEKGDEWKVEQSAVVPPKMVRNGNWTALPLKAMPGLCADMVISLDDRFLYVSQWGHGDVRQYDITDPFNVKLVGQCFVGGASYDTSTGVELTTEQEADQATRGPIIFPDGTKVEGGPNMVQLSLDGKRLYVTFSIYTIWDKQFYPEVTKKGSVMLQLDVNTDIGGLTLNKKFLVDFSKQLDGTYLAHEMRYPGGDCTSDIWL
ncbi:56kDa selenium binding protein (SBP56) domain-containing protein [Ditylenchus destructor]|uniref:Methanethiol oxidase n=1 Tax=Ditylenchus destructor TaxID=166010 RepID=A0AAD4R7Z8_9BILA|nr:56kDa selenium binding protein (SBP56) domain-containing protein [Ditylenchus destructor]